MTTIKGIGVDIEEVGRFKKLPYKNNVSFYKKIFSSWEIKYCLSKANPAQHFTARFAAKEAVAKALGKSVYNAKEIEVLVDKNGKPHIKLQAKSYKLKANISVSLSHTKEYAVAFAIWLN